MSSAEHMRSLCKTVPILAGLAALLMQPIPAGAVSPLSLSGTLAGTVRDVIGEPQMGAIVFLYDHRDRLCDRVITDSQGTFSFGGLIPDFYTVRVTLSSFLPALRDRIQIQAGGRKNLQVNLSTLFSSVQLMAPDSGIASPMSEDWKWVLRTSSARRPVLRILPSANGRQRAQSIFSDTHGLLSVSGGDSASDPDMGTAFGLATSFYGVNRFQFVGNVGYVSSAGLPSAGFLTTLSRTVGDSTPTITVSMRQLSAPGRLNYAASGLAGADAASTFLRTLSISTSNKTLISDSVQLEYGAGMDSVSYLDRQNSTRAYAKIIWSLPWAMVDVSYAAGNGNPQPIQTSIQTSYGLEPGQTADLERDVTALAAVPRLSIRDGKSEVQRNETYELGISRAVGSREFRMAAYRESIQNAALTASLPPEAGRDSFSGQLLPDFFSNTSVFNADNFQSTGYTASVIQHLGDNYRISVIYGYSGVLAPGESGPVTDADALRDLLRATNRSAVTTRASGTIARTGTKFAASYQWTDYKTIAMGRTSGADLSGVNLAGANLNHPDAGFNLYARQPIPSIPGLTPHMELTLDIRNMLAQGYVPFTLVDGRKLLLMRYPRTFRGGLSFTF